MKQNIEQQTNISPATVLGTSHPFLYLGITKNLCGICF